MSNMVIIFPILANQNLLQIKSTVKINKIKVYWKPNLAEYNKNTKVHLIPIVDIIPKKYLSINRFLYNHPMIISLMRKILKISNNENIIYVYQFYIIILIHILYIIHQIYNNQSILPS